MEMEAKNQAEALQMAQQSMDAADRESDLRKEKYENAIVGLREKIREYEDELRKAGDQVRCMDRFVIHMLGRCPVIAASLCCCMEKERNNIISHEMK